MDGAGISALVPTVGLGALPDPMGDATALLEARRRQQIEGAGYDPDKGLYDRYSAMLGTVFGPTINERAVAAREAMRRGDMATANALNQSLALDFGQFLGSIKPIRAYHGSPHDFDRFDMSKIGTGEGAQAYGKGLYFAESEDVAKSYRPNEWSYKGRSAKKLLDDAKAFERSGKFVSEDDFLVPQEFWSEVARGRAPRDVIADEAYNNWPRFQEFARSMNLDDFSNKRGHMYEVNINADLDRFLDFDVPGAAQSKFVRDAVTKALPDKVDMVKSESPIDRYLQLILQNDSIVQKLRDAGVAGLRFQDQFSRGRGAAFDAYKTHNYVVFDDKLIEILRKYGIMAPMAGAGVGSLYMDGEGEGM